jgi:hypothetical protein
MKTIGSFITDLLADKTGETAFIAVFVNFRLGYQREGAFLEIIFLAAQSGDL